MCFDTMVEHPGMFAMLMPAQEALDGEKATSGQVEALSVSLDTRRSHTKFGQCKRCRKAFAPAATEHGCSAKCEV